MIIVIILLVWMFLGIDIIWSFKEELQKIEENGRKMTAILLLFIAAPFLSVTGIFIALLDIVMPEDWYDG